MARLPVPGSDSGTWGTVLNDFLAQAHNTDGTIKDTGVVAQKYTLPNNGIPESDLDAAVQSKLNGLGDTPVTTQTGTYQITTSDSVILCNTTSGGFTVTLPTAVGATRLYYIKKIAAANTLTIATTASQTIDGSTSVAITAQYESITVVSDDANWHVV